MVVRARPGYRVVRLANGTYSLHSLAHDETFHPVIGPQAEAEALYVRQLRLVERLRQHSGEFVLWDVGLGAAANVLTVLRATREIACHLRVLSFDHTLEPLRVALGHTAELEYFAGYESVLVPFAEERTRILQFEEGRRRVRWELQLGDFPAVITSPAGERLPKPHAILFDAYSPATNPAMWTQPLFAGIFRLLDPNRPCAMPTYSRSTMLRVTLLLAGFYVGKGHATGEKEETTIAANRLDLLQEPLDARWLKRARASTSAEPLWEPVYRQARLSPASWERLWKHPQFISGLAI